MNKMFVLPSIWMIPVDTSVECKKPEIWDLAKDFLCCSFIFNYLSRLNT